ncbi:MAG TPA: hypothetical protein VK530_14375 [Candidatus Acidoferrum sp.]|nr:hypothetical protein [Candidatus Acidoferrum sp.]
MKLTLVHCAGFIAAILLLPGCAQQDRAAEREIGEHEVAGVTFSEKKGLHVSPETARFIGLRTAEVSERTIGRGVKVTANVYNATTKPPRVLASAIVSPRDAVQLQAGAVIEFADNSENAFTGRVHQVKSHWSEDGDTEVLFQIDDVNHALRVGSSVTATARSSADNQMLAVPRSAVLRTLEGTFAYTISGDHLVRAAIETGLTNAGFVEITGGLYVGDHVVTQPAMTLWLAELQAIRGGKACADEH